MRHVFFALCLVACAVLVYYNDYINIIYYILYTIADYSLQTHYSVTTTCICIQCIQYHVYYLTSPSADGLQSLQRDRCSASSCAEPKAERQRCDAHTFGFRIPSNLSSMTLCHAQPCSWQLLPVTHC